MGKDKEEFAILKAINYKDSSFEKIQQHIDYILNEEKTPKQYRKSWYVDADDAIRGLERLYKRYHPKGSRNFKHWIVSYGVPNINEDKAFEVSNKIAAYYAKDYPVILGLHTNIARRIHCHFLQNTVNVHSGLKFSQSKSQFEDFRLFVNTVLTEYGLPLLRGVVEEGRGSEMQLPFDQNIIWDDEKFFSNQYQIPSFVPTSESNAAAESRIELDKSLAVCAEGFKIFFEYGKGI